MQRYARSTDQWEKIKGLLPGKPRDRGVTARNNRLFVDAVLYRYRTGVTWRDLPERFGDFTVVHTRFQSAGAAKAFGNVFSTCYRKTPTMNTL